MSEKTPKEKMKAVVINCSRNGLGVIRALGQKGFEIIAVDHKKATGLYSKYVNKRYVIDKISGDGQLFIDKMIEIAKEHMSDGKIFLIPTNDIYVDAFSKSFDRLEPYYYPVFESDPSVLFANINKTAMYQIAEEAKIDYPRTFYDIDDVSEDAYPVIIKPDQKRVDDVENKVFRIVKCKDKSELAIPVSQLNAAGVSYVVQQYIPGGDDELFTAGVFLKNGILKAISCGRKIRQFPPQLGQCSFGELVDTPELEDIVKRFAEKSGVTGICQVEFKRYQGRYYLMEINPRSWSWNSLITYSGVNLPYIACMDIKHDCYPEPVRQKKTSGTWMFVEEDLYHNVIANRNVGLFRFLKDFVSANNFAHFQLTDPVPYLYFLYQLASTKLRKKR